jgi:methyl-accepting chemotaxis protein
MDEQVIGDVQSAWKVVQGIAPQAAALFYSNLFAADPSLKPLFKGDMEEQGKKLTQMIGVAVGKLTDPDVLVPALQGLARRHVSYGVRDEHYATVGSALLKTLEQGLGAAFTPRVRASWAEVYGVMSTVMIAAAKDSALNS